MYIQLDSQVLYYEHIGEGPDLILLHGNGESHEIFTPLANRLKDHFSLYLLDSRGCGLSSPAPEYHYRDMARDVANLIESQRMKSPAILGFSDGAISAMILASEGMAYPSKLILCGGNMTPKGLPWMERHKIKRQYKKTKDPLVKLMLEEPDLTQKDLSKINIPCLVLAGEKDLIRREETEAIAAALPHSTLKIIPGADHGSYIVGTDRLYKGIINFLGR